MTGPSQPAMSENVQKARQRLLRLGLTDEHVLSLGPVATRAFDPSNLQYASSDPHFGAMVQRILRFLRGGRGLSIAVTDDGQTGEARIHTALQLAVGLSRQGIQVVVVDMDFLHPGLGGLVANRHTEGLIDMVRFGRSCRSLLYKPVSEGPSILACGSFPVLEPMPLDEDAVRSVLHRVSLHCELALYVAPLQPDGGELNPVVRLCEHVVLVQSVSPTSTDIVERIQLMQQARLHVAGVVLFEGTAAPAAPAAAAAPSVPAAPPPDAAAPAPVLPEPAASQPPPQPTTYAAPAMEPADVPLPHIPWKADKTPAAEPAMQETPQQEEAIPEITLPNEEPSVRSVPPNATTGDLSSTPGSPPPGVAVSPAAEDPVGTRGEKVRGELWSEPESEAASEPPLRTSSDAARLNDEFDSMEFDDSGTEFAYDDGNSWSKTPLYILITLLVLTGGFFGWALWTKRGIEQQVGQQLSGTEWIHEPSTEAEADVPDDAAAMPQGDGVLSAGALEALANETDLDAATQQQQATSGTETAQALAQTAPRAADSPKESAPTGERFPLQMRPAPVGSADAERSERSPRTTAGSTSPKTPSTASVSGTHEYTVHVGSFRRIEQAYKDIATLQKYGYSGRTVRTDLGDKGIWYRVYVGGFPSRAEAEKSRNSILEHPEYRYAQVKRVPR